MYSYARNVVKRIHR